MGVREDTRWAEATTAAERLRWARSANGLTQEAFADRIGMKRGAYRKYETGETAIRHEHAQPWGKRLGVRGDWLLSGRGSPYPEGAEQPRAQEAAELVGSASEDAQEAMIQALRLMAGKRVGNVG